MASLRKLVALREELQAVIEARMARGGEVFIRKNKPGHAYTHTAFSVRVAQRGPHAGKYVVRSFGAEKTKGGAWARALGVDGPSAPTFHGAHSTRGSAMHHVRALLSGKHVQRGYAGRQYTPYSQRPEVIAARKRAESPEGIAAAKRESSRRIKRIRAWQKRADQRLPEVAQRALFKQISREVGRPVKRRGYMARMSFEKGFGPADKAGWGVMNRYRIGYLPAQPARPDIGRRKGVSHAEAGFRTYQGKRGIKRVMRELGLA